MNKLHRAACGGSPGRVVSVLKTGLIGIDQGTTPGGSTPLMIAAGLGHSHVARILLKMGANVTMTDKKGFTALHFSAQEGHRAVTKLLVKAGARLDAKTACSEGVTPLHLAADGGRWETARVLIEAGANPNSRRLDDATPLHGAAAKGEIETIKVLLRAKANPLLTFSDDESENPIVPLDTAAGHGHLHIVRELIQECGIEGCGGATNGVFALYVAALNGRVDIMELLTSAGVVDTGKALTNAILGGRESSVKLLLLQWARNTTRAGDGYLDTLDPCGLTPISYSIMAFYPRITRILVDAGANTTTTIHLPGGAAGSRMKTFNGTPLALAEFLLSEETETKRDAAVKNALHNLEAIRRLLMRVEAVHAVSWLWASGTPAVIQAAAEGTGRDAKANSTPLISMLPILRRRAGRPRVLLTALSRHSDKPY